MVHLCWNKKGETLKAVRMFKRHSFFMEKLHHGISYMPATDSWAERQTNYTPIDPRCYAKVSFKQCSNLALEADTTYLKMQAIYSALCLPDLTCPEIILSICPYALELPPWGNCPVQVFVILQDGCSFPSCVIIVCLILFCLVKFSLPFSLLLIVIFLSVPFFILFVVFGHPFNLLFINIAFCLASSRML